MDNKKLRLLVDMRPCFEGFSGIPQETRLLFASFLDLTQIETFGLINHGGVKLERTLPQHMTVTAENYHRKINKLARFVISATAKPKKDMFYYLNRYISSTHLGTISRLLKTVPIDIFDSKGYEDFIWDTFFSKTLDAREFTKVTQAQFRTISLAMHPPGLKYSYPKFDTKGYDVLLAQTPFPGRIAKDTQLIVRYHDAIPMFLPHLIPEQKRHLSAHYMALRSNAKHAKFVCTSEYVRQDLIRLFPSLEDRSTVIHDMISDNYFVEKTNKNTIAEIILSRIHHEKLNLKAKTASTYKTYSQHISDPASFKYILMVSTIEPRKNHLRLIQAWERLRLAHDPELKLILVGSLGWQNEAIIEAMKSWQQRSQLFHLSKVPADELRLLYSGAAAVICPSLAEGFDLSGVEAMACGARVAASHLPVHCEVYADAAIYFDPYSVSDQANAIKTVITASENSLADQLMSAGLVRAKCYQRSVINPKWEMLFDQVSKKAWQPNMLVAPVSTAFCTEQ